MVVVVVVVLGGGGGGGGSSTSVLSRSCKLRPVFANKCSRVAMLNRRFSLVAGACPGE